MTDTQSNSGQQSNQSSAASTSSSTKSNFSTEIWKLSFNSAYTKFNIGCDIKEILDKTFIPTIEEKLKASKKSDGMNFLDVKCDHYVEIYNKLLLELQDKKIDDGSVGSINNGQLSKMIYEVREFCLSQQKQAQAVLDVYNELNITYASKNQVQIQRENQDADGKIYATNLCDTCSPFIIYRNYLMFTEAVKECKLLTEQIEKDLKTLATKNNKS